MTNKTPTPEERAKDVIYKTGAFGLFYRWERRCTREAIAQAIREAVEADRKRGYREGLKAANERLRQCLADNPDNDGVKLAANVMLDWCLILKDRLLYEAKEGSGE